MTRHDLQVGYVVTTLHVANRYIRTLRRRRNWLAARLADRTSVHREKDDAEYKALAWIIDFTTTILREQIAPLTCASVEQDWHDEFHRNLDRQLAQIVAKAGNP